METSTASLPPPGPSSRPSSPPLDALVSHLLAAKRSLACISHVARANELVTGARAALEAHAILAARTAFVRRGCAAQAAILRDVHAHARRAARRGADDLGRVVRDVDAAEARLRATMARLRATYVERQLRPASEPPRTLADFVHDANVQGLHEDIGRTVAAAEADVRAFEDGVAGLAADVQAVDELLRPPNPPPGEEHEYADAELADDLAGSDAWAPAEGRPSPVPALLAAMEEHAQEMATNLSSLVAHFDLCVTALKHTEGGGAAASRAVGELPDADGVVELPDPSTAAPPEPLTAAERIDMLGVLQQDAAEVDDVVAEIRARAADLEAAATRVVAHGDGLAAAEARAAALVRRLQAAGAALPVALARGRAFAARAAAHRARVGEHVSELADLRAFYAGFLRAYDGLLVEVGRRQDTARRLGRTRRDMLAKLDQLVAEEVRERDDFRRDMGDWLPMDLWAGLMAAPVRWEVVPVVEGGRAPAEDGADGAARDRAGEGADSVPDVSASIINKAIKRITARDGDSASNSLERSGP